MYMSPRRLVCGMHVQRGASMLEALVALLVLVLGVLGLARLQVSTLMEARNTDARSVAIQAASDLLDRMQVNTLARQSDPDNPNTPFESYKTSWDPPTTPEKVCFDSACSSAEMASFDVWHWKQSIAQLLPGGNATVFRSNSDPSQLGVLLAWSAIQAKNQGAADAANALLYEAADALLDASGNAGTGVATATCPAQHICHLVYIRP